MEAPGSPRFKLPFVLLMKERWFLYCDFAHMLYTQEEHVSKHDSFLLSDKGDLHRFDETHPLWCDGMEQPTPSQLFQLALHVSRPHCPGQWRNLFRLYSVPLLTSLFLGLPEDGLVLPEDLMVYLFGFNGFCQKVFPCLPDSMRRPSYTKALRVGLRRYITKMIYHLKQHKWSFVHRTSSFWPSSDRLRKLGITGDLLRVEYYLQRYPLASGLSPSVCGELASALQSIQC
mmetsp:Transcript_39802/g.102518  ORF Transcript_39802/g.102518 Transcript_39802/m.102518 type:complete len:230 (-) Transcript_39802:48-737(-)